MSVRQLSVKMVADELSVHPETVKNWIKKGELLGRQNKLRNGWPYEVTRTDLDAFIKRRLS